MKNFLTFQTVLYVCILNKYNTLLPDSLKNLCRLNKYKRFNISQFLLQHCMINIYCIYIVYIYSVLPWPNNFPGCPEIKIPPQISPCSKVELFTNNSPDRTFPEFLLFYKNILQLIFGISFSFFCLLFP